MGIFFPLLTVIQQLIFIDGRAQNRHSGKNIQLPFIIIQQTRPRAGKAVDGIAEHITSNQATTEIQRLPSDNHLTADTAVIDVLIGIGEITLYEIGVIDRNVIDSGPGIRAEFRASRNSPPSLKPCQRASRNTSVYRGIC
jgi:hypothetical protein